MKVVSRELALVLVKYEELPQNLKESIDFNKQCPNSQFKTKGEWIPFEVEGKYLIVNSSFYEKSILGDVYGELIDRTNENSFDTELFYYFYSLKTLSYPSSKAISVPLLEKWIDGMGKAAKEKKFSNLWHIITQTITASKVKYESSYSQLLIFYSIVEFIMIYDGERVKGESMTKECGRKLEYFIEITLKNPYNAGLMSLKRNSTKVNNRQIGTILTRLRSKVIHGELDKAQELITELVPIGQSLTEDAESSEFQDRLKVLNNLISNILYQILIHWMENPEVFWEMKTNYLMGEDKIRERFVKSD